MFTPVCDTCGRKGLPASLQYKVELRKRLGDKLLWHRRGLQEMVSEFALFREALTITNERDREAQAREGLG